MNPTTPEPGKPVSFEEALAGLETIVRDLEAGDISLEEALAKYESGVGLLKQCYAQLRQAEQKILLLAGEGTDGRPITQPFEHTSSADPLKPAPRRLRRGDSSY